MLAFDLTGKEDFLFQQHYVEALQIMKEEAFLKEAQATAQARNPPKKENLMLKARPSGWPSIVFPWHFCISSACLDVSCMSQSISAP